MVTAHFSKKHNACFNRITGGTIRLFYNPMGQTLRNHSYVSTTMIFFGVRENSDHFAVIPNEIFDRLSKEIKDPCWFSHNLLLRHELSS